jgi:hypothetical protein
MRHIVTVLFSAVAFGVASAPSSFAAPRNAVMAEAWNAYFWLDGSGQRVNLPSYNLGPATNIGLTSTYGAQIVNLGTRAEGYGISGGAGYFLPKGMLFGSNARVEFGAAYVHATGSQTGSSGPYNPPGAASLQFLSGQSSFSFGCVQFGGGGPGLCNSASAVSTTYDSWQFNGKVATDFKTGAVTLTPSFAVFGGTSRNSQALTHVTNNGFSANNILYNANTQLRWVDWGARVGTDADFALTQQFSLGLGGSIGVASRRTNLSGNDASGSTNSGFTGTSSVSAAANKGAFLANAEASISFRPTKTITLRTFAGLNYDNAVPGIVAPSFSGPFIGAPTTAATIGYQSETSYYAGGGLSAKF